MRFFKTLQQLQRPVVIRARTHLTIEARYVFEVVVEDVRRGHRQNIQGAIHAAAEIRDQRFDFNRRVFLANGADAVGKMLCAAITQVVTVYRGDYDIAQTHIGDSLRQLLWLVCIWRDRASMRDVAERATAGTDRAEDHKGRGTVVEALCKVRAGGLFAHGVQAVLTHRCFDSLDTGRVCRKFDFHPFRFSEQSFTLSCHVFHRDKGHFIGVAVLNTAFHHNGFTHSVRVPVASHEGKRINSMKCCNYQLFLNQEQAVYH